MSRAVATARRLSAIVPRWPGTVATPAACASFFAAISPRLAIRIFLNMAKRKAVMAGLVPAIHESVVARVMELQHSVMAGGWVYIMTNRPNGTLYTGVTA